MKILTVILAGACTAMCSAELLYDLSPYDADLAFAADSVFGQFNNQRIAETFELATPSSIEALRWWGRSEGSFFNDLRNMESFTVAIFSDSAGLPGTQLASETALTTSIAPVEVGATGSGIPIWEFNYALSQPLVVESGNYWLSVGSDNFDPDGDGFYWQAALPKVSDNFAAQVPVGSDWEISGFADLAFQVHGAAVPEPTGFVGLAALSMLWLLRKKRS
jgi:hypothetical protein